ncbi:MAG: hypothetical protein ACRD0P_16130 [Stackebrandtia sp.]
MKRMKLLLVAAVTVALAGGATAYATADDIEASSNKTVSNGYGKITFIDKGDKWRVCDTKKDGRAVEGYVVPTSGNTRYETDGGDSGCDYFTLGISGGSVYQMGICRKGGSSTTCRSTEVRE